ncbi:Smp-30/Cgr1 family protein [Sulfitobacter noctilucicola]|uniref:Sugar lactone lactonase YvrE n=1 Tax=Sulfitobacter noctilucicola TaxID=1342301 RepID=A0A7W6Q5C1_9RHOB|nr:SMP-30/gluconolactonase/LRE family protein [Sulfitobacter noctilucicola]KIN66229.1 Smp-30/Cgr1 family protein [Sulfitobacter noctilucicola]MBB4175583.1 sugar lactone lactonase YvrE [Sulfitobacter noctilucicola]
MTPFDATVCALGEGPLWHPERGMLFWFDILGKRLYAQSPEKEGQTRLEWRFDTHFSAAGWVDRDTLLLASEAALWRFNIDSGAKVAVCALDADNPVTRSNDGRADPWGGFWIGSMGKETEPEAGAIYRYYRGELRQLKDKITVSNAISFAPDKSCGYYTDTVTGQIMRQPLSAADGWPDGDPTVFADLKGQRLNPDGAVTDAEGNLWVAMWGAACVVCFAPDGTEICRIDVPARQPTCPAFGGPLLRDLYLTSATTGLNDSDMQKRPLNGQTFVLHDVAQGVAEPRVLL